MHKIKMTGERQRYVVRARNERFAVLTKPFNVRQDYLYCITDLERGIRGPCNFIFGLPFAEELTTPEGAEKALAMLASGEMAVSRRHIDLTEDEIAQLRALEGQG
ncbi:hypothetical protein ACEPPZ_06140 [Paracoccus yeei]|uniref:hypothetical protein n=1 Tax=Paracoccus yeei TaxID=147645 RepID=UPI0037D2EE2B